MVSTGCFVYKDELDSYGEVRSVARGLEISPKAVRLDRLNRRAPVLDNHRDSGSIHDQVGSVEKAWIEGGAEPKLMATLRISKVSPKEKEIALKIKHKIINSVSVGADIYKENNITKEGDAFTRVMAVDWEPVEVSLVPIPADAKSIIRNLSTTTQRNKGMKEEYMKELSRMMENMPEGMEDLADTLKKVVEDEELMDEDMAMLENAMKEDYGMSDEQKMAMETFMGDYKEKMAGMADEKMMMDEGEKEEKAEELTEVAEAAEEAAEEVLEEEDAAKDKKEMKEDRKKLIRELLKAYDMKKAAESVVRARETMPAPQSKRSTQRSRISAGTDYRRKWYQESRAKVSDALSERIGLPGYEPKGENEFRDMKPSNMFRELLYREGNEEARNWDNEEVYDYLVTKKVTRSGGAGGPFVVTSDLADIFSTSVNKSVQQSYEFMRGQQTFDKFVKRVNVNDFQTQEEVGLGEFGKLRETPPGAPTHVTPITDEKEEWAIKSYTNSFQITRQAFINDNTGQLESVLSAGTSAADLESDLIYEQLNAGTVGGQPWASAANRNLTTGAPLNSTTEPFKGLRGIFVGLARQRGLDVDTPLNLKFKYLVVPAGLYDAAEQSKTTLTGGTVPDQVGQYNAFAKMYDIIYEPRLDAFSQSTYYGIAAEAGVFRKFLLLGTLKKKGGTPKIKFLEKHDNDVLSWKLTHDVGAKIVDYRLAHKVTA